MLLVVFGHIETFGFDGLESVLSKIFVTFRMPLFFFISGYISYKADVEYNIINATLLAKKKILVQLLPTIIFGLFYTYFDLGYTWSDFLWHPKKYGYWFTISLLEMFLIYYLVRTISHYLRKTLHISSRIYPILLVIISSMMFLTKRYFNTGMPLEKIGSLACLNDTFRFFHYFVAGIWASMYNKIFIKIIDNKYSLTICIVLFIGYITVLYDSSTSRILNTLFEIVPRYSGLLIVYAFFYRYQSSFSKNTLLGNSLQYIGTRTLDIYMLHYFLIPSLPSLGIFLRTEPNCLLELFLGLILSIGVVLICLIISNVFRLSPLLAKFLFGVAKRS